MESVAITYAQITPSLARDGASFHQLRVVADSVPHTRAVQNAALAVLDPDPASIQVVLASAANSAAQDLAGTFNGFGRSVLLLILGAGAFFVAAVVLADVLIRRRDLGRRRTLGITRTALIALVATRTVLAAAVGAAVGVVSGLWVASRGTDLPLAFAGGVAFLATLTALIACLPPALLAASRDPVEIMRTP